MELRTDGGLLSCNGILASIVGKRNANKICASFVAGGKTILGACIMIGIARSVALAMDAGNILDTIVYYIALFLEKCRQLFRRR